MRPSIKELFFTLETTHGYVVKRRGYNYHGECRLHLRRKDLKRSLVSITVGKVITSAFGTPKRCEYKSIIVALNKRSSVSDRVDNVAGVGSAPILAGRYNHELAGHNRGWSPAQSRNKRHRK
jgi:hypothetical protein